MGSTVTTTTIQTASRAAPEPREMSYLCAACEARAGRPFDACDRCGSWGTCIRAIGAPARPSKGQRRQKLADYRPKPLQRLQVPAPWHEALGGGLVAGSVLSVFGRAGVGKTTLLLELAAAVPGAVYCALEPGQGPDSLAAVAARVGFAAGHLEVIGPEQKDDLLGLLREPAPSLIVLDSLSMFDDPVRTIEHLRAACPRAAIVTILHVTKQGKQAGTGALEHLVDARVRVLPRALAVLKNRHGPAGKYPR